MEKDNQENVTRSQRELIDQYPLVDETYIYTQNKTEYNEKKRFVYCQYCKYRIWTGMLGAKCKKCESNLITIP